MRLHYFMANNILLQASARTDGRIIFHPDRGYFIDLTVEDPRTFSTCQVELLKAFQVQQTVKIPSDSKLNASNHVTKIKTCSTYALTCTYLL